MNDSISCSCLLSWLSNPRSVLNVTEHLLQRKSDGLGKCLAWCLSNARIVDKSLSQLHLTMGRLLCSDRVCTESWDILLNSGASQMWHLKMYIFSVPNAVLVIPFESKSWLTDCSDESRHESLSDSIWSSITVSSMIVSFSSIRISSVFKSFWCTDSSSYPFRLWLFSSSSKSFSSSRSCRWVTCGRTSMAWWTFLMNTWIW